jgi:4-cresol dehydrogenase (hydroxylating)
MPTPEYFEAFFFRSDHDESLPAIVDALRPLRLNGSLASAVHLGNAYKVISGIRQFPWELTKEMPLSPHTLNQIAKEFEVGHWNASGAIYGTRGQVAESRRLLKSALRGKVNKLTFLNSRRLHWAGKFAGLYQFLTGWDLRRTLDLVRPLYGLLQGVPTDHALRSTYWIKKSPPPANMDPDREGCGLIWCVPVAPLSGAHAARLAAIATEVLLRHGFEPMLSITLLTERTLACVVSISYDRDVPGEDDRAMHCHAEVVSAFRETGYHFYRLGIASMQQARQDDSYGRLLRTIKAAVDPGQILAPGRYETF